MKSINLKLISIVLSALCVAMSLPLAAEEVAKPVVGKSEKVVVEPWTPNWRGQSEAVDKAGYSMVIGLGSCIAILFCGLALA